MKQRYVYVLAIFLTVVGLSVFAYKWRVLGFPISENQDMPVWTSELLLLRRQPGVHALFEDVERH